MSALALVAAWLAGPAALAQAPAAPDMTRPPAVAPVKPYRLPPRTDLRLPNGLQAVFVEDHRAPLVTIRLGIRGGKAATGAEDAGLADALAELLTDGAGGRSSRQIAEEADAIGGDVSASAAADYIVVDGSALSDKAGRLMDLVRDVALKPEFPSAEVELRKKNMLEELRVSRAEPRFLARLSFFKQVYAGHPYAVTEPTEASIARIDRDRVAALHRRLFRPDGARVVLVGDLSKDAAEALLRSAFGAWISSGEPVPAPPPVQPPAGGRRVYLIDRPGSAQTVLYVGHVAIPESDPDYFPLLLANQVLGGSFSGRLMQDLRERRGYTYGIISALYANVEAGAFGVGTQVRTEVSTDALKALLGHLERIREEPVSADELAQAKNFLAGRFTRGLETQAGVADALLHVVLHRLSEDYLDRYVERVQAVDAKAALEAARRHIDPSRAVVVAVGDAAQVGAPLGAFSKEPVRRLSVDGDVK